MYNVPSEKRLLWECATGSFLPSFSLQGLHKRDEISLFWLYQEGRAGSEGGEDMDGLKRLSFFIGSAPLSVLTALCEQIV